MPRGSRGFRAAAAAVAQVVSDSDAAAFIRVTVLAAFRTAQATGVAQTVTGIGRVLAEQTSGLTATFRAVVSPQPQPSAARMTHVTYAPRSHRDGATASQEAVGGRSDWASITAAEDAPDTTVAIIQGSLTGARGGRLVMGFDHATDLDQFTITGVDAEFLVATSGTLLNNGDVTLQYRLNGGAWVDLEVITGNVDHMDAPGRTHPLSISSWADLRTLELAVQASMAATQTWDCVVDAFGVRVHLDPVTEAV